MFKIYSGATEFKQWDLDQLVVNDCMKEGDEVVFCAHGKAYETTAFVQDGKVVADVPNFLLQESGEIRVDLGWGLDVHLDCRTYLAVTAQAKPKNYVCEYNIKDRTEKGVAGGTGGDCDWNIMKNKPFYSEIGEVVILPETTAEFDPDSSEYYLMDMVNVVVGNTYTVVWNGVEYPCTAASCDLDGVPVTLLGNIGAADGEGSMTEEPFLLTVLPAEIAAEEGLYGSFCVFDGSTSATISIYTEGEIVKTIDPKYLPEALQFGVDYATEQVAPAEVYDFVPEGTEGVYKTNGGVYYIGELLAGDNEVSIEIDGVKYTGRTNDFQSNNVSRGLAPADGEAPVGICSDYMGSGTYLWSVFFFGEGSTHEIAFYKTVETVKKIDKKFIPESDNSGGSGLVVRFYTDEFGLTADVDPWDIYDAVCYNGMPVVGIHEEVDVFTHVYTVGGFDSNGNPYFYGFADGKIMTLTYNDDGAYTKTIVS